MCQFHRSMRRLFRSRYVKRCREYGLCDPLRGSEREQYAARCGIGMAVALAVRSQLCEKQEVCSEAGLLLKIYIYIYTYFSTILTSILCLRLSHISIRRFFFLCPWCCIACKKEEKKETFLCVGNID